MDRRTYLRRAGYTLGLPSVVGLGSGCLESDAAETTLSGAKSNDRSAVNTTTASDSGATTAQELSPTTTQTETPTATPALGEPETWSQHHDRPTNRAYTPAVVGPDSPDSMVWRREMNVESPVTVADGRVYVGTGGRDTRLLALDARTGEMEWVTRAVGGFVRTAPAVADGRVVVEDNFGVVSAFDATTGEHRWRFETTFADVSDSLSYSVPSSPTVAGGSVFVGDLEAGFYALSLENGTVQWQLDVDYPVTATPAVDGNLVIVGAENGVLAAYNVETGEQIWRQTREASITAAPTIADDTVYVTDKDTSLVAFDEETGRIVWAKSDVGWGSPAVTSDHVWVGRHVVSRATGEIVGTLSREVAGHTVGEKRAYATDGDGVVTAFNRESQREQWRYDTGARIGGIPSLALTTTALFVPSAKGLFAIEGA